MLFPFLTEQGLSHHEAEPGEDQSKFLLLVRGVGFWRPRYRASWVAAGFGNINSVKNSGLPRSWKFISGSPSSCFRCCPRFINTLMSDTLGKKNETEISVDYNFFCYCSIPFPP